MFAGIAPSVGAAVSRTVTANDPELVFPAASRAVQVTVVVAIGNVLPETGVHVTVGVETASVAAGVAKVTARPAADVASAGAGAGIAPSAGAVVSTMLTSNVDLLSLLDASRAVHVTVVEPSGKVAPEAGLQLIVGDGSALSETVGFV